MFSRYKQAIKNLTASKAVFLLGEIMSTVSKLQIVLEATTTAFDRGLRKAQDGLNAFAKQTDQIHAKMERFQKRHQDASGAMQAIGAASAVGLAALGAGIKVTTDEAMKFESAMAEVKKVVDFETPDGIKQMRRELEDLSTRVPIAFDGLAKIAAAAGQSGIAANEIVRFTESAAKMGTAFEITAEQAGQAMAEMRVAFRMSQGEVETLADKINYLGNTSPNNAAKIMEITQAVGAVAELGGFAADQVAALSSVIVGIDPSSVATGMKNISLRLTEGANATKAQRAAFERLGLSAEDVAKRMKEDAVGTLMEVTRLISETIPEHEQSAISKMLVGQEALPVFAQLVQNQDVAIQRLKDMGDASKYAGSMNQEAANINETSAAKMDMFKNAIQNAKAAIGDAFLPAIGAVAEAMLPVINSIKEFAQENPTVVAAIAGIAGGALALGATLGAIGLAVPLVTAAFGGLTAIAGLVGAAIGAVSLPVVAVVAAIGTLVAAGVYLYRNWDELSAKAKEIWTSIKNTFTTKVDEIKTAVIGKFYEIKGRIATIISGFPEPVRTALNLVYSAFQTSFSIIKTVVQTSFAFIKNIFTTAFNIIKALVRGDMDGVKKAIGDGMRNAWNIVKEGVTNIANAFKGLKNKLIQAGKDAIQGLIDGITSKFDAVKEKVGQLANYIPQGVRNLLDIRSPSRVMREIGAWAGEGFVLGIGDKVKDAKQVAQDLANALTNTVTDLHRQNFMLKNHEDPLAELRYKLNFGELAGLAKELKPKIIALAKANHELAEANKEVVRIKDLDKSISNEINNIYEKIQTHGMNRIQILEWQIENTQKYAGASEELIEQLKEQIRHEETLNAKGKRDGYQNDRDKNTYLYRNQNDKYASDRWDLSSQGFDAGQVAEILGMKQQADLMTAMVKMPKSFTMPTLQSNNLGSAVSSAIGGYTDLKTQLDNNLKTIQDSLDAQLITEQEAYNERLAQEQAFQEARQNLILSGGENVAKTLADSAKSILGANSKMYRALFAVEKGFAIARSVVAIQQAIALASANPFPMNLGAMATVASQVGSIISTIKSVQMPVGQAHDGIMSVPKSGTWNLEKGERVLPEHTAQNLDNTLNRLQGRGETKVIINNYTSEKAEVQQMPNGDTMVIIGRMMKQVGRAEAQQVLREELGQNGLISRRLK